MSLPPRQTSAMAVVSLIMGILGWTALPLIGSVAAIITGHLARAEIRRRPLELEGDGMVLAGLILGWIIVIGSLLALVVVLLFFGGLAWFAATQS